MPEPAYRLESLDALRGCAVAGMILVNTPGSWAHIHPWLQHAAWHGCRPADLVFPFFLFAAGASLACARALKPRKTTLPSILHRAVVLFGIGLVLNCLTPLLHLCATGSAEGFAALRIMGVLQRIALAWGLAACIVVWVKPRFVLPAALALLGLHWLLLICIPVPGFGSGQLTPEVNAAGFIDRSLFGVQHMYRQGLNDPEGLLGTLACIATVLLGVCAGRMLLRGCASHAAALRALAAGAALIAGGLVWSVMLPLNKTLWTGSFALYSTGWALVTLVCFYQVLDVRRMRAPGFVPIVIGRNALLVFVAAAVLARLLLFFQTADGTTWHTALYTRVFMAIFGPDAGSLLFSVALLVFLWPWLYWLYRQKRFVRA